MGLLYLLSYLAALAAIIFITLSLASGLLWVAELIEEHSRMAKTIGQRAIWGIIVLHALLYFDGLPFTHLLFSVFCHFIYSRNITSRWPLISLKSPIFIISCILVFVDHFLFFTYFSQQSNLARQRGKVYDYRGAGSYGKNRGLHSNAQRDRGFGEIATFFALCVWAIPLFLFLGLSSNDSALPTQMDNIASQSQPDSRQPRQRSSLLKRILDPVLSILPGARQRSTDEDDLSPPSQSNLAHPGAPGMTYSTSGPLPSPGLNAGYSSPGWASPSRGEFGGVSSPPPPRVRKTQVRSSGKED
ncbi:hypothetical protein FRC16_003482 [Serendipita sp. 398]|nr:hypothetical protein FRC16_003482 [Serendipita sp. 398]